MRIDKVEINNFRKFEELNVELHPNFNIISGVNNYGKTSLLDAIGIGCGAFTKSTGYAALKATDDDIRATIVDGELKYKPQISLSFHGEVYGQRAEWSVRKERVFGQEITGLYQIVTKMIKDVQGFTGTVIPIVPVVPVIAHFPALRSWPKGDNYLPAKIEPRLRAYRSAFDPVSNHNKFREWFTTKEIVALQKRHRYEVVELGLVRSAITSCLRNCKDIYHDFDNGFITLAMDDDSLIPLDQSGSGMRDVFAMVGDIAYRCCQHNPHLGKDALKSPGIVLIDEPSISLKSFWKWRIPEDLMRTFPNIQFVVSTNYSSVGLDCKFIHLDKEDEE